MLKSHQNNYKRSHNFQPTLKFGHVLQPIHRVVVHVAVDKELEGRLYPPLLLAQLLPGGHHPLAQHGVIHPVPKVDKPGVLLQQAAIKVHGQL